MAEDTPAPLSEEQKTRYQNPAFWDALSRPNQEKLEKTYGLKRGGGLVIPPSSPGTPPGGSPLPPPGGRVLEGNVTEDVAASRPPSPANSLNTGYKLSAATPEQVRAAQTQPPLPPRPATWGQTAWRVISPVVGGVIGGNVGAGAGAAAGEFMAEAPFFPPDPRTDPMGAQQVKEALPRAARVGLETFGAGAGASAVPIIGQTGSVLDRMITGGARAIGAGAGASAGSLAAEPVDPTKDPLQHALRVGGETAAGQAVGGFGAAAVKRAAAPFRTTLTEEGSKAAQTLSEQQIPIPASTSHSRLLKTAEFIGEESLIGGTWMSQEHTAGEKKLIKLINDQVDAAKTPPSATVKTLQLSTPPPPQEIKGLYPQLDKVVQQAVTHTQTRPVYLPDTLAAQAGELSLQLSTQSLGYNALRRIAASPGNLTLKEATDAKSQIDALLRMHGSKVAPPTAKLMEQVQKTLTEAIDSPRTLDMRTVRPTITKWVEAVDKPWLPPSLAAEVKMLKDIPDFMSFDEAKTLRSTLMAVGRSMGGGGAMAAPTSAGTTPVPGMGGRFDATRGAEARDLASAVKQTMSRGAKALGPEVDEMYQHVETAYAVNARAKQLEYWLSRPAVRDSVTGTYKGKALLNSLAGLRNADKLEASFPEGVIANIKKYATALDFLQQGRDPNPRGMMRALSHTGAALTGPLLGAGAHRYGGVSPMLAGAIALSPTALGFVFQSPMLTHYLTLGMTLPPGTPQAVEALGRVMGVLHAEGLLDDGRKP